MSFQITPSRAGQQAAASPVHVCETHAGWRRRVAEDFPADIDVAPTGPARIRSYEALEYVQLVVPPPPC